MTMKLLVLGVMYQQKQAHGYQVYRELVSWQPETSTKIRPGSIYHALTQLTKEEMLIDGGTQKGQKGSSKTVYSLTNKGERELAELVSHALISFDQKTFSAGIAFMSILTRSHVTMLAERRLVIYKDAIKVAKHQPGNDLPLTPKQHSAIISSWSAILNATLRWQEQFVDDLRDGRYRFMGDSENQDSIVI